MEVVAERLGDGLWLRLCGPLTVDGVTKAHAVLLSAEKADHVDCLGVTECDSAGAQLLWAFFNTIGIDGVEGVSEAVRIPMEALGLPIRSKGGGL